MVYASRAGASDQRVFPGAEQSRSGRERRAIQEYVDVTREVDDANDPGQWWRARTIVAGAVDAARGAGSIRSGSSNQDAARHAALWRELES